MSRACKFGVPRLRGPDRLKAELRTPFDPSPVTFQIGSELLKDAKKRRVGTRRFISESFSLLGGRRIGLGPGLGCRQQGLRADFLAIYFQDGHNGRERMKFRVGDALEGLEAGFRVGVPEVESPELLLPGFHRQQITPGLAAGCRVG